jgi:RNA polymerase sigma-70 factor (ECF subfamily)
LENSDSLLFAHISNGNKAAFDTLFRKYYCQLVRFAISYTNDSSTAEEIVQDTFVKIWENAPRIKITTTVGGYIYNAVKNHCINYIKHITIKKKYEKEQAKKKTEEEFSNEEKVNINLFRQILSQAVNKLPEKCREIFEMAKFDGLSYDEISDYLEISTKTVENQMGIALKKLRENILPYAKEIYEQ